MKMCTVMRGRMAGQWTRKARIRRRQRVDKKKRETKEGRLVKRDRKKGRKGRRKE